MTCDRFHELLADAIDDTLDAADTDAFAGHHRDCATCRQALAEYRRVIALAGDADFEVDDPIEPVSQDMSIGAIFLALRGKAVPPRWVRKPLWRMGIGRYT